MQDYGAHILKCNKNKPRCLVFFVVVFFTKCNNSPCLKTTTSRQEHAQKYGRERKSGGEREEKVFTAVVGQRFL